MSEVSVKQMRVALVAGGLLSKEAVTARSDAEVEALYKTLTTPEHEDAQGGVSDATGRADNASSGGQEQGKVNPPGSSLQEMLKNPSGQRATVTSKQLQDVVERILGNSQGLSEAVQRALRQLSDEDGEQLRADMGLDEYIDQQLQAIAAMLSGDAKLQAEALKQWMEEVEQKATTTLRVELPDVPTAEIKDQHFKFADLLFNAAMRIPSLLVGPTGTGKTTAALEVAKALKMEFGYVALSPTMTEAKFSGFVNAVGEFNPSPFYLFYRYGGVLALDEMDAGNEGVTTWLNGAVMNKLASFPYGYMSQVEYEQFASKESKGKPAKFAPNTIPAGGMVKMHPDFVLVASANTYGKGADMMYHGRRPIDFATFKRFKFITWDYDEKLEMKLAPLNVWTKLVQTVRACVMDRKMQHAVSTVDSIDGGKMILAGKPWQTVAQETIFAGLRQTEIDKVVNDDKHGVRIAKAMEAMRNWKPKESKSKKESDDGVPATV